ncbi:uncharacterized protein LOC128032475 isoform X1 [Gossypium raimondii]|uniref:uncharacterized protein LOC128032475 isoform X1 n=1 Tax=Gossypium raimondii TaxID=29730 RepID=UPI00227B9C4C|nr:uncharacterized protein LOC128032475 isoform X1 [Gossypium raimondii]
MLDSFFNMSLLLNNPQTTTNWEIRLKMDEVGGKELAENLEILTTKAKPRHCITLRKERSRQIPKLVACECNRQVEHSLGKFRLLRFLVTSLRAIPLQRLPTKRLTFT